MENTRAINKKYVLAFLCLMVKNGFYFFKYFPLLDDYIQYYVYGLYENPLGSVFLERGVYKTRPLAGLFDLFVWGNFKNNLGAAFFIITILHFACYILNEKTLNALGIKTGMVFMVFYLLFPLSFEGTYFISASSRVVVGWFFASLSLWYLVKEKKAAFFIFGIFAVFFYEQISALFLLAAFYVILNKKSYKNLFLLFGIGFLFIIYYLAFSKGNSLRGGLAFTEGASLKSLFLQVSTLFTSVFSKLIINGFKKGLWLVLKNIPFLIFFAAVLVMLLFIKPRKVSTGLKIFVAGFILAVCPLIPFVFLKNVWFSARCVFPVVLGLSLMAQCLLGDNKATWVILFAVFSLVSVSELYDYKKMHETDTALLNGILPYAEENTPLYVLNCDNYYKSQNSKYHEHIASVLESDWALTGAIRAKSGKKDAGPVFAIQKGESVNVPEDALCVEISENLTVKPIK